MRYTNRRNPVLPVSLHVPDSEAHVMRTADDPDAP